MKRACKQCNGRGQVRGMGYQLEKCEKCNGEKYFDDTPIEQLEKIKSKIKNKETQK